MHKFHIIFHDPVTPTYYDTLTLEHKSLGGTESTVLRLAEGLGKIGLKVGIIQNIDFDFEPIAGNHCLIMPRRMIAEIETDAVIHLRSVGYFNYWPKARQFVWVHDDPTDAGTGSHNMGRVWLPKIKEANAQMLGVSDWQVNAIKAQWPEMPVTRIYPPVDDKCYSQSEAPYDPNSLIWLASPHKGLKEALPVFRKLKEGIPELTLTIFNPGYFKFQVEQEPGVLFMPETPRQTMRALLRKSLCLFYPSYFRETFGLIAAEAEAAGVPVACYNVAALGESVRDSGFCRDEEHLIETVKAWHKVRPVVKGQARFKLTRLLEQYVKFFDGKAV